MGWQSMNNNYGSTVHKINTTEVMEDDVIEYRRQIEKDIIKRKADLIVETKNSTRYRGKDFYICLLTKIERIGQQPQFILLARLSCPTPTYKQTVWKYNHVSDSEEFVWTIPDAILYYHVLKNAHKYLIDPETKELAQFVTLMESGEMEKWVIKENGNLKDAIIKINPPTEGVANV